MSQFAPKRIFNLESLPACNLSPTTVNGQVIANGSVPISPPNTPTTANYEDILKAENEGSNSPGIYRTQSYDAVLFDLRKIPPEKIAAQLTLIDLPLFKAIRMEEFANCNWTKKEKVQLAPNIVAFTRKFNHTSFWVVREILNEENPRTRAEILAQFIKIAKKLHDLNNLHSLKAVVAGLQSTPIYRLTQTWKSVPKREKAIFDRLGEFLSDENNRKILRDHMNAAKLPCIPHLGIYLTDLSFLHSLNSRGHSAQVDTIMNMIAYCQNSTYDGLVRDAPIQKYLMHVRYIDELQKFFEDDNYQLSLRREPDPVTHRKGTGGQSLVAKSQLRTSKSHEDLLTPFTSISLDSLSTSGSHTDSKVWTPQFQRRELATRHSSIPQIEIQSNSTNYPGPSFGSLSENAIEDSPSVSKKLKTSTLPSSRGESFSGSCSSGSGPPSRTSSEKRRRSMSDNNQWKPLELPLPPEPPTNVFKKPRLPSPGLKWRRERGHLKSHSLGNNIFSILGIGTKSSPTDSQEASPELPHVYPRNLIDDSVLDETFTSFGTNTPTGSLGNMTTSSTSSLGSADVEEGEEGDQLYRKLDDVDEISLDFLELSDVIKEGVLKRKVLKRNGRSLSLRRQTKCWAQLTPTSLLLYPSKPKTRKSASKSWQKPKGMVLKSCRVRYRDPQDKASEKQFIVNDENGNHVRFTGKTVAVVQEWVERIKAAIAEEEERERREVEKSLIKL